MTRQAALAAGAFFIAAIAGALLSTALGSPIPAVDSTGAPVTTTSTTIPVAYFVDPAETALGPAVLVADDPEIDGDQLTIRFELVGLAPTGDSPEVTRQLGFGSSEAIQPSQLVTVYPDLWVVNADGERIDGGVANPDARVARFDVGSNFDLETIDSVAISSYALKVPIDCFVEFQPGDEFAELAPGLQARLVAVTEQAKTIVQVELIAARGYSYQDLRVTGAGPQWLSAVREAEGRPRWNLTFDSAIAPEVISLRVEGTLWITIDREIPIQIGTVGE